VYFQGFQPSVIYREKVYRSLSYYIFPSVFHSPPYCNRVIWFHKFKICHTTAKDRLFTYISRTLFRCVFHTILHRTIQIRHFILLFLSDLLEDHVKILCSRFCWHAKSILFCFLKWYKKHPLTLRSEVIAGEERYGHNYKFINMGRPAN